MNIGIVGQGNVGTHLLKGLQSKHNVYVIPRSLELPHGLDLILVAVSDDQTLAVVDALPQEVLVAHTAGSVPCASGEKRGVFYPLYSFSKSALLDWQLVPLLLEGSTPDALGTLESLAKELTDKTYSISSEQRQWLHASAVAVNNFTNHLYSRAFDHIKAKDIPVEVLHPIMLQGPQKAIELGPENAQTGPAIRRDASTVRKHQAMIEDETFVELYNALTKSIDEYHNS